MEDNNSIVGIKVNETTIPAKCIMIIKKYQDLPISEIKQKIEDLSLLKKLENKLKKI